MNLFEVGDGQSSSACLSPVKPACSLPLLEMQHSRSGFRPCEGACQSRRLWELNNGNAINNGFSISAPLGKAVDSCHRRQHHMHAVRAPGTCYFLVPGRSCVASVEARTSPRSKYCVRHIKVKEAVQGDELGTAGIDSVVHRRRRVVPTLPIRFVALKRHILFFSNIVTGDIPRGQAA